jgi:hypothetical protein
MIRALPVLACLSALLLLPATAGARLRSVEVDRGETAIVYEGAGETSIPTGEQCDGATGACRAWGYVAYRLHWDASVIVNRQGTIHGDDSRLHAAGSISIQPNAGIPPGAPLATSPACNNDVHDRRDYIGGVSVTLTQRSVGVQAELPFSRKWLNVTGDPNHCQLGPDTWAGSVFSQGLDSAGQEQSDADAAKLQLAVRPKMGARRSARRTTRRFDFDFMHDTGTGSYGIYKSEIDSAMVIFNDCKRLDAASGRCLSYYG